MKKLLSLALIGVGARWLKDKKRRAALIGWVDGARGGLVGGTENLRASAGEIVGSAVSRAGSVLPGVGSSGDSGSAEDTAALAGNPDDARLTDKIESELFRDDAVQKGDINVNVEFGKVVLRGQVESQDMIDDLVGRARQVEGVNDVENLLHLLGDPAPMHE